MDDSEGLSDTSRAARELQLEIYRRMTPGEKLALVLDLIETSEAFTLAGVRTQHPRADARERVLRLAERKYGRVWLSRNAPPLAAELPP